MVFVLAFQFFARIPKGMGVGSGWWSRFWRPGVGGSCPIQTHSDRQNRGDEVAKIGLFFGCAKCMTPYYFIKIMQPVIPNYNWENGVKQTKITEENLSQNFILCQLLRTKTLTSGSICIKHFFFYFYHYLPYICWVDVIYLTCLVFLKYPNG